MIACPCVTHAALVPNPISPRNNSTWLNLAHAVACASGKHYPEARLVVRKAGGSSPVEYLVITLKEVMVVSYSTSAESKDDLLYDRIALNFATVDVSYQPQKADGAKDGGPVKFGWNIRQNVKA